MAIMLLFCHFSQNFNSTTKPHQYISSISHYFSYYISICCYLNISHYISKLHLNISSRQPRQNSLPLETRGSFGYSATLFSGLMVFGSLSAVAARLLRLPLGGLFVAIFLFQDKSDGIGAHNLLSRDTTGTLAYWPSSSLAELSNTSSWLGPLASNSVLLLIILQLLLPGTVESSDTIASSPRAFTGIMPVKLPDYSSFMLYAFTDLLCRKLCRCNRRIPTTECLTPLAPMQRRVTSR